MNRKTSQSTNISENISGQQTKSQLSEKSGQSNNNQETKSECENFTLQKCITVSRLSMETGVSTYSDLSDYDLNELPESELNSQIQPEHSKLKTSDLKKSQTEKCCSIQ